MNNRAFSKIWIVVVLVIFLAGGIFAWQYFGTLEEAEVPEEKAKEETAEWKVYTNTKYNYQLKVPQDFWNKAKPSAWVNSSNDDSIWFAKGHQWYIMVDYVPDASFYNPPSGTELISWLKENEVLFGSYQTLDKPNFEIGGIPAVKMYSLGRPQAFNADIIYFIRDNKLFQIQALADTDDESGIDTKEVKEICNQILSTFRFIEEEVSPKEVKPEITCQDECSRNGLKKCSGNDYQICGNYDEDSCLEWSSAFSCAPSEVCESGYCTIPQGSKLLLLVEDSLYGGLSQELATYENDVKRELGLGTVVKTFSSSANIFGIKSYVKKIYNSYKLNGVLLIGNLPVGKFYNVGTGAKFGISDRIYQDIHDHCEYSEDYCWSVKGGEECGAFDWLTCGFTEEFWIARLTPNSSIKDLLSSLKDYFKRNHQYRIGGYSYKPKFLIYTPQHSEIEGEAGKDATEAVKSEVEFLNAYDKNDYKVIDIEKENSDQLYLTEIKKPYEYEGVYVGAHGSPTWHQFDIGSDEVINSSFFLLDLGACSAGKITAKDYVAGKYLFEGEGLAVVASARVTLVRLNIGYGYYPLTKGEPLYRALLPRHGLQNVFVLGDPTLKMRYGKESLDYRPGDPIIAIGQTKLTITRETPQPGFDLKVKNSGKSSLHFNDAFKFYSSPEGYRGGWSNGVENAEAKVPAEGGMREWIVKPGEEATISYYFGSLDRNLPAGKDTRAGNYKGMLSILSTDPVNPFIIIPFETILK